MLEFFSQLDFQLLKTTLVIECWNFDNATALWGSRKLLTRYLQPFWHIEIVRINVHGEQQYPPIKLQRNPMSFNQQLANETLAIGLALKASAFIIHSDGTYLEYLEAGHPGQPIISYTEMIGQKAMERLPEPLRSLALHYHNRAAETGLTQHFVYSSPLTQTLFRELLVPYPSEQIVVHYVLPADPSDVPTPIPQLTAP